jgi:hypothetical protein
MISKYSLRERALMQPNDPNQVNDPNQPPAPLPQIPAEPIPQEPNPVAQPTPDLNVQNSLPPQPTTQQETQLPPPPPQPELQPLPPTQPIPLPNQPLATPSTQPNTPLPPPPPVPQSVTPDIPKRNFPLKKLLLIFGILTIIAVVAILSMVIFGKLGSNAPKYSKTKTVELVGFSTDENSGMSFEVPEEMEETLKTDLSADYVHKAQVDKNTKGELGNVNAAIETVSYTADVTDAQKKEIADKFNSDSFDTNIEGSIGSGPKNVKVVNKTVSDDNSTLRAEVTLDIPGVDDKKEYVPAKGVITYKIIGKRMYLFVYAFTDEVFKANEGFIKKMEEGVKYGV